MFRGFRAKAFLSCLWMSVLACSLIGCVSLPAGIVTRAAPVAVPPPAPVFVIGNGNCRPAADLPSRKTMTKVPEKPTYRDELYGLLLNERMTHKQDIDQYNSLYSTCVEAPAK